MSSEAVGSAIPHISALDGARGLAVAGVLLFHGGHLTGGYLGVDFFFTLSGFLITSLLLAESDRTESVGLGGFWARRARRLLPALAVLMVGVAVYSIALAKPSELTQIRGDAFATLGYVANWHQVFAHQSYFALFTAPSPLNHTWSLAIEEQFYVIWPLLFVALLARFKRDTPKAVLATSLALAGVSSVLMSVLYDPANTNRVYFGTDTRAAAILLGAALAAWLAIHGPASTRTARIAVEGTGLGGAVVLAIAWTRLDGQSSTLYRGGFLVCGLAATAIIAAAVHPEPGPVARMLSLRPLCALGLISYGVYLYHWPINVAFDQQRAGIRGWPLFLLQTSVTLAAAIASYRIIEMPIRRGALSSATLRKLTPAIAIVLGLALVVSTNDARPLPGAAPPRNPLLAATQAFQTAPPGAQRVMIVGNSVAYFLGQAIQRTRFSPPVAAFNASVVGCAFPPQVTFWDFRKVGNATGYVHAPPCGPSWEVDAIARFRPNVAFWIPADYQGVGGARDPGTRPCTEPFDSFYRRSLKGEIVRLGARGAHVVVTTQAYTRPGYATNSDRALDCENRLIRTVAAENGAQLVDLFEYICPNGRCREKQSGVTLRPDGIHYESAGATIVATWLLDQVR